MDRWAKYIVSRTSDEIGRRDGDYWMIPDEEMHEFAKDAIVHFKLEVCILGTPGEYRPKLNNPGITYKSFLSSVLGYKGVRYCPYIYPQDTGGLVAEPEYRQHWFIRRDGAGVTKLIQRMGVVETCFYLAHKDTWVCKELSLTFENPLEKELSEIEFSL